MASRVEITKDAYFVCLSHALTTEKEEVMGMCLGDVCEGSVVRVWAVVTLTRSDKRADRVEISPEQLASAAALAEHIGAECGTPTRVVGWYHSHPHISVHPSHVDLATQRMCQALDRAFVGLIFSVFSKDSAGSGRVQGVAFQAAERSAAATAAAADDVHATALEEVDVPLVVVDESPAGSRCHALARLVEMQRLLQAEERAEYDEATAAAAGGALAGVYNAAVYQKALCKLLEYGSLPLLAVLREKRRQQQQQQL